jgi:hypothetical protein
VATRRVGRTRCGHVWIALRLSVWFLALPLRLRRYSLPELLKCLTPVQGQRLWSRPPDMDRLVRMVVWVSHRRLFRLPGFPRACLRQSLALYYVLTRLGYPVTIHFGIQKAGETLRGHSWVTVQGTPVAELRPPKDFRQVYAYASTTARTLQEQRLMLLEK